MLRRWGRWAGRRGRPRSGRPGARASISRGDRLAAGCNRGSPPSAAARAGWCAARPADGAACASRLLELVTASELAGHLSLQRGSAREIVSAACRGSGLVLYVAPCCTCSVGFGVHEPRVDRPLATTHRWADLQTSGVASRIDRVKRAVTFRTGSPTYQRPPRRIRQPAFAAPSSPTAPQCAPSRRPRPSSCLT